MAAESALQRFQEGNEVANLIRIQLKLWHGWMARYDSLG